MRSCLGLESALVFLLFPGNNPLN
uniref:Uncharacterized protein n=1 Tax=Arundo donax TaxID=35708 RepID=A0A0A9FRG7_ARUDO